MRGKNRLFQLLSFLSFLNLLSCSPKMELNKKIDKQKVELAKGEKRIEEFKSWRLLFSPLINSEAKSLVQLDIDRVSKVTDNFVTAGGDIIHLNHSTHFFIRKDRLDELIREIYNIDDEGLFYVELGVGKDTFSGDKNKYHKECLSFSGLFDKSPRTMSSINSILLDPEMANECSKSNLLERDRLLTKENIEGFEPSVNKGGIVFPISNAMAFMHNLPASTTEISIDIVASMDRFGNKYTNLMFSNVKENRSHRTNKIPIQKGPNDRYGNEGTACCP